MIFLNSRRKIREAAYPLFNSIVLQARAARFYRDWGVADSVDGRFDMIVLHVSLVIARLESGKDGKNSGLLIRYLQEVMFDNMDLSLREMGVGDMSVGKKVKHMADAFNGRHQAYLQAIRAQDMAQAIKPVLIRNIYRGQVPPETMLGQFAAYVLSQVKNLQQQPDEELMAGQINFEEV